MSVTHPAQVTVTANDGVTRTLAADLDALAPTVATVISPAPGAVARTISAKAGDVVTINDFGISDPTSVVVVAEDGKIQQAPSAEPYERWRPDIISGAGVQAVTALIGDRQQSPVAINRTTTATVVVGGVETTAAANTLRFQDNPGGLLIEQARTNSITVPDAPVAQTGTALAVASYYLRIEGSGSITVTLATGTATGLPLTVTAATPGGFAVTVAATVNIAVTGSVTFAQLENGQGPTSRIHTNTTKTADTITIANVLRNGRDWLVAIKAMPNFGLPWGPNLDDRGLFTIGDNNGQTNSANGYYGKDGFLHFQVTDNLTANKTISAAFVFLGNIEHDFWFYGSTDGMMEAWIDGERVAHTFTGATGTGIITTMPTSLRPCSVPAFAWINGVCKDFRIYYDTKPVNMPKPIWTRTITPQTVACIGDSITFGLGVTTPYPTTLQASLGAPWTVLNAGVSGDTTWQMRRRWGAGVRRQSQKYVVAFAGTNDLNAGQLAATAWNNLARTVTQARTDGKTVLLVTTLPRTPFSAAQNAERVKYNGLIRAYCAAGGAILVDADPSFDNGDGTTMKVSLAQADGIHPNQAGADLLASLVLAAVPH